MTCHGERLEMLPGFVPPACCPKVSCEQGRAVGLKRELVGPAKPKRRERSEGPTAVRLADSTPRSGEPATWGSGQRAWNCDFHGHDLALVVDDEVQLEAEKPPHAG